ncbi:MAG: ABC transporter ATP-binding protein [Anaerolineae bacterium]
MEPLLRMGRFIRPYWRSVVLALLLLIGVVVTDLLIPRLTQRVIDQGIATRDMGAILGTSLLMLGAALLSALFAVANTLLSVRAGLSIGADLRSAIARKVQTFSFGNLDDFQTGQLIVRSTSDVSMVEMVVQMGMRILARAPLWALGSMAMLVINTPQLALITVALLPVIAGLIWFFLTRGRPLFLTIQEKLDRLNQVLQENLAGVRVVKAFVRGDYEIERFERANLDLFERALYVMRFMSVVIPTLFFLVNLAVVGVVWFGGVTAIDGDFTVGQLVAGVNYMLYAIFPVAMLGMMVVPISSATASAGRIWEVLDSNPDVNPPAEPTQLPEIGGRVAFEDVCFSYDGQCGEPVLQGIDLVAEPGQTVALLGATGSGKSTLVHLIPRFYDVDDGRVLLDGVDVRDLSLHQLRTHIGVALQEPVLFTGTMRDNIRYGRLDASEDEVIAAARAAQAHDFITSFPEGYDTQVGQRGVNLSGGQKQRIAIARALLVKPDVLILDASTSNVDVQTEIEIERALERVMADATTFVIAQRISSVLAADKIVVLDRGRVAAEGTHEELMATSEIYREIYRSQLGDGGLASG